MEGRGRSYGPHCRAISSASEATGAQREHFLCPTWHWPLNNKLVTTACQHHNLRGTPKRLFVFSLQRIKIKTRVIALIFMNITEDERTLEPFSEHSQRSDLAGRSKAKDFCSWPLPQHGTESLPLHFPLWVFTLLFLLFFLDFQLALSLFLLLLFWFFDFPAFIFHIV